MNRYNLSYEHNFAAVPSVPDTFVLKIETTALATNHEDNVINMNDALGSVKILNAKQVFIYPSTAYEVHVVMADGTTDPLPDAVYDEYLDVLTAQVDQASHPVWLPGIVGI